MVKVKKNVSTSRKAIKRLAKKTDIILPIAYTYNLEECKSWLSTAYKEYYKQKPNFEKWRNEFNESKIDALAKEEKTTADKIRCRIKREQKAREMGSKARSIRAKGIKDPVLRATATDENGNEFECNSQETMIPIIAKSNLERQ